MPERYKSNTIKSFRPALTKYSKKQKNKKIIVRLITIIVKSVAILKMIVMKLAMLN